MPDTIENGKVIKVYYVKDNGNVIVKYLEKGTNKVLVAEEARTGKTFNEEYEEIAEEYQEILPTIDIFKFDGVHYLPQLEQSEDFVEKLIDIIYSI